MVKFVEKSIFDLDVDAIVNPVNCVGVMGGGLALEFKIRYPEMFERYHEACKSNSLIPGSLHMYKTDSGKYIINFPTKYHYINPSKEEFIVIGLDTFTSCYKKFDIKSVAFPKLGCGLGGLDWDSVRVIMESKLNNLDIDVFICV